MRLRHFSTSHFRSGTSIWEPSASKAPIARCAPATSTRLGRRSTTSTGTTTSSRASGPRAKSRASKSPRDGGAVKNVLMPLAALLLIGAIAPAHAELPPPTADEKAAAIAKVAKDAAAQAEAAKALQRAQDKAVANYRSTTSASHAPDESRPRS